MKQLFCTFLMIAFMTNFAFAVETTTDCPMMRELNERNNPKANLGALKPKVIKKTRSSAQ